VWLYCNPWQALAPIITSRSPTRALRLGKAAHNEACTSAYCEIESDYRELGEQSLDECLTLMASCRGLGAMNGMQEL
jgi:hypothetical protein